MRSRRMCDDGLYVWEQSIEGHGEGEWVRVSDSFNTPARVSDPRTGGAYGLWLEFNDEQRREKRTVIPAAMFHGNTRDICARLSDLGLYINREYQEHLINYLQGEMQRAPSADLATTPGWITSAVYALPDAIYGEQDNGRTVYYGGDTREHNYRTRGTLAQWQTRVARPCEGNSRAIAVLSAGFAGPLMADAGESSGGFHLWSKSTTGKTTLLLCGGSVCGGGDARTGFMASWRTTTNGLEPLLASHNDGALFLDEIGQADARAVSQLIYTAGNSSGKHRMTRELTAAPTSHWRALVISSGEHTLEAYAKGAGIKLAGGAAVRLIDIPADAGKGLGVFENLHGAKSAGVFADRLKSAALECYGVSLREFLSRLTCLFPENRRAIIAEYREQFLTACNLSGACPEVLRAANRMAVVAAAGELAVLFDILPWEPGAAIDGVRTCFSAWRLSRGGDAIGHDDARAIEQVRLFIERYGDSRFESASISLSSNERVTDRAGWRRRAANDGTEYLVQPEFFRSEMCKGFDPAAVARALLSRGYLRRQGRHWTVRTTIPGAGKRELYCILDSVLSEASE